LLLGVIKVKQNRRSNCPNYYLAKERFFGLKTPKVGKE